MVILNYNEKQYDKHDEMIRWCEQHFGRGAYHGIYDQSCRWAVNIIFAKTTFYFKSDTDAMLFKLTWGPGDD